MSALAWLTIATLLGPRVVSGGSMTNVGGATVSRVPVMPPAVCEPTFPFEIVRAPLVEDAPAPPKTAKLPALFRIPVVDWADAIEGPQSSAVKTASADCAIMLMLCFTDSLP